MASTLEVGIELWNHAIDALKTRLESPEAVLAILDAGDKVDGTSMKNALDSVNARITGMKKIQLKGGDSCLW